MYSAIVVAIAKPINAECGLWARNPQGRGVCGAWPRHSSFIWNNQISLLVPSPASTNPTIATAWNGEIGSSTPVGEASGPDKGAICYVKDHHQAKSDIPINAAKLQI